MDRLDSSPTTAPPDPVAAGHLARLFAMSPDLMAAAGFDGLLKRFNDAWEHVLGWPRAELERRPYLELVHPDDRAATEAEIAKLARGETVAEYVCRILTRDGGMRFIAWSGGPGDEAFYIVGRDVTERLVLEQELARRAERLQITNTELQQFAYVASHDLSEPLRMVTGYLDLLERRGADRLDADGRQYLSHALGGARQMRGLIDDLLLYSRVANEEARREQVDLAEVVAEVLRILGPRIQAAAARVEVGELPVIEAEPRQMTQLLQNLIGNAIKFQPAGTTPTVRVSARRAVRACVLTVADDGIGIPFDDQERIFAMFTRLHSRELYEGTGIGLAICRRIAERHGGRIYVESQPGDGSAFHVLLPDAPAAAGRP